MKKLLFAFLLAASSASAQTVTQSGSVTPGHAATWVTSGVIRDAGTAASPATTAFLTSLGIVNNGGPAMCFYTAHPNTSNYNRLCFSVNQTSDAQISIQNFGTATAVGIGFLINGVAAALPVVSIPGTIGHGVCYQTTGGQLHDCGFAPFSSTLTAAHIYVGNSLNIATDVAMSGDATLDNAGTLTIANNAVTNAKLATMVNGLIKCNVAGGAQPPSDCSITNVLDIAGNVQGNTLYRSAASWTVLAAGTTGALMVTGGAAANPAWSTNLTWVSPALTIGSAGSATGQLKLTGATSGTATVACATTCGTPSLTIGTGSGTIVTSAAAPLTLNSSTAQISITSAALTKTDDTNVTLTLGGAPTTALLTATSITAGWTGQLAGSRGGTGNAFFQVSGPTTSTKTFTFPDASATVLTSAAAVGPNQGGTGFTSYTIGDILYADGTTSLAKLADVAVGNVLTSGGTSTAPAWGKVSLTAHVTGILALANGGSGANLSATGGTSQVVQQTSAGGNFSVGQLAASNLSNGTSGSGAVALVGSPTLTGNPVLATPSATAAIIGSSTTFPSGDTFVITANATTLPVAGSGATLHLGGANGASTNVYFDSFAAGNSFVYRRANTTAASPSALASGDNVANILSYGYGSTGYSASQRAAVQMTANQTWTDANQGMRITFSTTPDSSTTLAEAVRIQASGGVSVGVTTDPGIGSLQLNAQMFMPNITQSSAAQTGTVCWTTGTGKFTVDTTTTCLLSSARYKHDIQPLDNIVSLNEVLAMRGVSYVYNEQNIFPGKQIGLIAEDVANIDDRLISREQDGSPRAVRYQQLTALLIGAIQELHRKINLQKELK